MEDENLEKEEKANAPSENPVSKVGATGSLIGLIFIGAAVYLGLPHIQKSIKSAITSISTPVEEGELTENEVAEKEKLKDSASTPELEKGPTRAQDNTWTSEDQQILEAAAEGGIRLAIRGVKRDAFKFLSARRSVRTDSFLITFEFDKSLYELKFTKDEEFARYISEVAQEDLQPHFSIAPSFSISN